MSHYYGLWPFVIILYVSVRQCQVTLSQRAEAAAADSSHRLSEAAGSSGTDDTGPDST